MREPWRSLALAAAFNVIVAAGVATAQTVVVTNAPPGSTVELMLNAAKVGSATADATGKATLPLKAPKRGDKTEMTGRVYVDACDALRRVLVFELGQELPPLGPGCTRKEFTELFALRSITTLVVDVGEGRQAVWVKQGRAPAEWLRPEREGVATSTADRRPSPKGVVLFGGASLVKYRDAVSVACGNAENCSGGSYVPAFSVGAAYWITRFLAAEAAYVQPADVEVDGSGNNYRFLSSLDAHFVTFAGKAGYAYGPFRLYGQAGANYSWTMTTTTETIGDYTYTVDGVSNTLTGGTQTFQLRTGGWGWLFGGGAEFWVSPRFAIYGEAMYAQLKGSNVDSGEGSIDDRGILILGGVRFHIGR